MATEVLFVGSLPLAHGFARALERAGLTVSWVPPELASMSQDHVTTTMRIAGRQETLEGVVSSYLGFFADVTITLVEPL